MCRVGDSMEIVSTCYHVTGYRPEFSCLCVLCVYTWLGNCTLQYICNSAEVSAVCVMVVQGSVAEIYQYSTSVL